MAIRLRVVDGQLVALCAARSVPQEGDTYLDDGQHYALAEKFWLDYADEFKDPIDPGEETRRRIEQEEILDPPTGVQALSDD